MALIAGALSTRDGEFPGISTRLEKLETTDDSSFTHRAFRVRAVHHFPAETHSRLARRIRKRLTRL